MLSTVSVDNFALPGDAAFPLNALYHAPGSRVDSGESSSSSLLDLLLFFPFFFPLLPPAISLQILLPPIYLSRNDSTLSTSTWLARVLNIPQSSCPPLNLAFG
jgi:hypothetical protein